MHQLFDKLILDEVEPMLTPKSKYLVVTWRVEDASGNE